MIPIMIDNKAALSVANHPESSPRTRHICLREFRIRDMHEARQVRPYLGGNGSVPDLDGKWKGEINYPNFLQWHAILSSYTMLVLHTSILGF